MFCKHQINTTNFGRVDQFATIESQNLNYYLVNTKSLPERNTSVRNLHLRITAMQVPNEQFVYKTTSQQMPPLYKGQNIVPQRCPLQRGSTVVRLQRVNFLLIRKGFSPANKRTSNKVAVGSLLSPNLTSLFLQLGYAQFNRINSTVLDVITAPLYTKIKISA